jgi:hypothetical protein
LPLELLGMVAEDLSPIDLLALSHTNRQLNAAVQQTTALQKRRERAVLVQAAWRLLPQNSFQDPQVMRALSQNWDSLEEHQHTEVFVHIQNIAHEGHRATALAGIGPALAPEHQANALAIAQAIADEWHRATALAGIGPALAPEHQANALAIAQAIAHEGHRARALAGILSRGS